MSIKVLIKNVYGEQRIYPADELAKTFADLVRQKTFTTRDITLIKQLGFRVEVVSTQPTEL